LGLAIRLGTGNRFISPDNSRLCFHLGPTDRIYTRSTMQWLTCKQTTDTVIIFPSYNSLNPDEHGTTHASIEPYDRQTGLRMHEDKELRNRQVCQHAIRPLRLSQLRRPTFGSMGLRQTASSARIVVTLVSSVRPAFLLRHEDSLMDLEPSFAHLAQRIAAEQWSTTWTCAWLPHRPHGLQIYLATRTAGRVENRQTRRQRKLGWPAERYRSSTPPIYALEL
jgi:hypothetical protein